MLKVTVLGCGSSAGVPYIGCDCAVCKSTNPKNKRTRVSILIETQGVTILVDASPDIRAQCLANNIRKVDAIIFTHAHADHVHGIDDTRAFNFANNAPLDVYSDQETLDLLNTRFAYVFRPMSPEWGWYRPCLVPHVVTPQSAFNIGPVEVLPVEQQHGKGKTLGLRIGKFAYSTDTNGLSDESLQTLKGIDTWLVDCLREEVAPTHAHLDMTLGWIAQVKPKRSYLTHMNHSMEYETLAKKLPDGILPAYDGLVFEVR